MKIAILSDSHDNIPNIKKTLKWINKEGIKTIIHCGDLCAPSTLFSVIIPNFTGDIYLVNGNVGDPESLEDGVKKYPNVYYFNDHYSTHDRELNKKKETVLGYGEIELDGKKIAFTHSPSNAKELAQTGQYDYVFYGHTHKPWEEKLKVSAQGRPAPGWKNEKLKIVELVNPGTLAGMFYKATFAVLDTKTGKLELKILEKI